MSKFVASLKRVLTGGVAPAKPASGRASPVPPVASLTASAAAPSLPLLDDATVAALPAAVELDGIPFTGCELRLRIALPPLLDALSVSWFRFASDDALPPVDADIMAHPSARLIPGATGMCYALTDMDVGYRVGAVVRLVSGAASRWVLCAVRIRSKEVAAGSLTLTVAPHTHHKYCDRRVRVCTAPARFREGNTVEARFVSEAPAGGYHIAWYRSAAPINRLQMDEDAALAWRASHWSAASTSAVAGERHRGSVLDSTLGSTLFPDWAGTELQLVAARAVSDMPPCPSDSTPSPPVPVIQGYMAQLAAPPPDAPNPDAAAAGTYSSASYPLFHHDIGRILCAVAYAPGVAPAPVLRSVVIPALAHSSGSATGSPHGAGSAVVDMSTSLLLPDGSRVPGLLAASPCVGGVEAAPPKAREIWIDGTPAVGNTLTGCCYYYGGVEGDSIASWIGIAPDGETVELGGPSPSSAPGARTLTLLPEHAEYLIKFRLQPVRADGEHGHTESSRPTKEVAPAASPASTPTPAAAE